MKPDGAKARLEAILLQVWYGAKKPAPLFAFGLSMLESLYKALRLLTRQHEKSIRSKGRTQPPVLVVGNLIAGGAGKTPIVMAVCNTMRAAGKRVGIVSRGYGRSAGEAFLINPQNPLPKAADVGDEPLFLAMQTHCPIAVGAHRNAALELLLKAFPDIDLVVSDDGLQHHRLTRQLEWIVFDSRGQGNGRLLPAGPLREPLSRLNRVDAVLASNTSLKQLEQSLGLKATGNWQEVKVDLQGFRHLKTGEYLSANQASEHWKHHSIAAFTGIGNPDKLFSALEKHGLALDQRMGLPDHFDYPLDFCTQFNQTILITSGKDAVKLDASNPKLWVAEICIDLPPALTKALEDCIGSTID